MTEKLLLKALGGEVLKTPPIWLMRQAGRYLPEYRDLRRKSGSFLNMCYDPKLSSEVTLQPIRRFGFDAAIIFSDILVVPHAMGLDLDYVEGEGPKLSAVRSSEDIKNLLQGNIKNHLSPVFEAIEKTKEELPEHVTMIGFAGAPWTVATYMAEGGSSKNFTEVKKLSYANEEAFSLLMEKLIEETAEYLKLQVKAGAEVLQIFDSWAGILSENDFKKWSIEPTRKLVEKIKQEYPGIKIIGFPKSAGIFYEDYVKYTGVDAVGIDYTVPLKFAAEKLQSKIPVQGNLDPVLLVAGGEKMQTEVKRIMARLGDGAFIFNLGHGILPETPIENVELLLRTIRGE